MKDLTALSDDTSGLNSGVSVLTREMKVTEIHLHPEFVSLFPIKEYLLEDIVSSMKQSGYDESQPVHVWKEEGVLLDGHTRLEAAKRAGFFTIPVFEHSFGDMTEALEYAYKLQHHRRNLSDAERIVAVEKMDCLKKTGRKTDDNASPVGRSSERLAKTLGTSPRSIEKIRTILRDGSGETIEAVKSGELSSNAAYNKVQESKKKKVAGNERLKKLAIDFGNNAPVRLTLYETVKEKSVSDFATWLAEIQTCPTKTSEEWIVTLNTSTAENPGM